MSGHKGFVNTSIIRNVEIMRTENINLDVVEERRSPAGNIQGNK